MWFDGFDRMDSMNQGLFDREWRMRRYEELGETRLYGKAASKANRRICQNSHPPKQLVVLLTLGSILRIIAPSISPKLGSFHHLPGWISDGNWSRGLQRNADMADLLRPANRRLGII